MAEEWKKIKVSLKSEDLEAYINVPFFGEEGGLKAILTVDDARKALHAKGISDGIRNDELERIFQESIFDEDVLAASGTPPLHGENARIEYYFKTDRDFHPQEDKDGRIDYHEVSFLSNVKQGQELCRRIPPTDGKPGRSLLGREIKANAGKDVILPQGPNTELSSSQGPDVLVALCDGCVTFNKTKLVEVKAKLEIKGDVDFNTGNLQFNGALVIGGDIKAGFTVETTGDLEVGGVVEDAQVIAGGSALIKKGFIGHGNGLIKTGGELTIKFAQNQKIRCGGNLNLGGEMMHCETRVGGDVVASGRKGAIIGGHVLCEGSVEVPQIGSVTYTQTVVEVGCNFQLEDRRREIQEEQSKLDANQDKIKNALYILSRLKIKLKGELPPEQEKLYGRLQETIKYYPKYREELKAELGGIDQKMGEHRNAQIKVTGTLYPGSKLVIGKFPKVFNEKMERTTFREVKGEIVGAV
ncbi:MAG: FapA family protein [Candidatus Glassbacteria bacterium]